MKEGRPRTFSSIKAFAETAKDANLSKEERRDIFDERNKARLRGWSGGSQESSVGLTMVTPFLSMLEGDSVDERDLVQLGNVLREYGTRGTGEQVLSEKDMKLVSLAVKYFERWFYDGGPVRNVHELTHEEGKEFAAPAFIVNQLAKIKESRQYQDQIAGFDEGKLEEFLENVEQAAPEILSEEQIDRRIAIRRAEIAEVTTAKDAAEKEAQPFRTEILWAEHRFHDEVLRIKGALEHLSNDVDPKNVKVFKEFSMTVGKYIEYADTRTRVLYSNKTILEAVTECIYKYAEFDDNTEKREADQLLRNFTELQNAYSSSDIATESAAKSKPQRLSGLAALGSLSEDTKKGFATQAISRALNEIGIKKFTKEVELIKTAQKKIGETGFRSLENKIKDLEWDTESTNLFDLRRARAEVLKELPASLEAVRESLTTPGGDMYFLKTCLIAANELRSENQRLAIDRHIPNVQPLQRDRSERARPVYEFTHRENAYDKVHMEPSHYLFCQLVVEYLWRQDNPGINFSAPA
ncbi:MAG: hypothetical protein JWN90_286 [Parcubacteria group bacterium]|nr:hypothetical protein [Parcubacteria group bacterium]